MDRLVLHYDTPKLSIVSVFAKGGKNHDTRNFSTTIVQYLLQVDLLIQRYAKHLLCYLSYGCAQMFQGMQFFSSAFWKQ